MAESHREEIAKLEALYAGNPGGRVFVHLAEAYRKAGEHERARRILDEGLARHPDSASGYVVLGRVLADMQVTAEAEIAFQRVLDLDGGNLIALRWLGDLARQSGRNAEAATHYRELLIRNPSNEEVRDLVEIVERDPAGGPDTPAAAIPAAGEEPADAFAGLDTAATRDEPALAGPTGDAEEAALGPPAAAPEGSQYDVTPWAAAPGQTGDAEEPPVEFGLVELETAGADGEEAASDRPAERAAATDESDVVASVGDGEPDLLELDELRRDDEAEPLEIHLLDPSFEPAAAEEGEAFAGELDLSDLASAASFEDEEDYADEIFVADLSAAGREEPEPDELPGGVDVMQSGAALTLLPEAEVVSGTVDAAEAAALPPAEAAGLPPAEAVASEPFAEPPFTFDLDDAGAHVEPPAPEIEPPAPEIEPGAPEIEPGAPEIEPGTPEIEPGAPEIEPAPPDIEPAAPDIEPAAPELEPAAPDLGSAMPEIEAAAPDLEAAETDSAPAAPDLEVAAADAGEPVTAGYAAGEPVADAFAAPAAAEGADESMEAEAEGLSEFGLTELAGAAEPAAESSPVADVGRGPDTGLVTETMAVLYRSQGFHDRAADVYRSLLRARPGDDRLAAKLREAEDAAGATARPAADDDAGEVWLRGVGAAWTGPEVTSTEDATPYAWTGEPEDGDAGEPIGSYLHDLISWKAGSGAWPEPASDRATQQDADIEVPEWLNGPQAAETWPPVAEPPGYPPRPAAEADWSPAQPVEPDPWENTPGAADTAPEPAAPEDPWTALPEQPDSLPDVEYDEGEGWTPLDLDRDVPARATPPDAAGPRPAESTPAEDDSSDDDDDLEMFRSWLQSLKK